MRLRQFLCGAIVLALAATPVWAQSVDEAPETRHWVTVVLAIVLGIAVGVVALLGSRRGHRD